MHIRKCETLHTNNTQHGVYSQSYTLASRRRNGSEVIMSITHGSYPMEIIGYTGGIVNNDDWRKDLGYYTDDDANNINNNLEDILSNYESLISYDRSRRDTVSDINWGMTVIANSIKVISAIITIISPDNNKR